MMDGLNIVIAGVGGQGTVLASRVLAQAALNTGLPARTSETIGMAQREGSVQSHVRIGMAAYGPVIGSGQADILLGFEPAETLRAKALLRVSGQVIGNIQPIYPVTVTLGTSVYPLAPILAGLKGLPATVKLVEASKAAHAAGNFRTVNTVMLGALFATGLLPFSREGLLTALTDNLPARVRAVNEVAFALGEKL